MTETRKLVYFFGAGQAEADGSLVSIVGGKGASLADMTRAGLPVPPGFTISAECCQDVLAHPSLQWPTGLQEQVQQAMHRLEQLTARVFGQSDLPLLVAVRSGAAISMPGMMDTILNVGMHATLSPWDELVQCINAVFKSWNSQRAIAYRQRHHIDGVLGTAVTIQAMFPSQVAGVVFTADPNDPAANRMIIEASLGLGEVVVSGEVTPDRFLVPRTPGQPMEFIPGRSPQHSPVLNSLQVEQLCQLGLKVESHFGKPVDIEWGLADGHLVLLQCRPIKGLDLASAAQDVRRQEIARLGAIAGSQEKIWVAHNLGETLRAPTPLTWDIVRHFMSGRGGFGLLYQDLGFRPSLAIAEEGFLDLICGRIYADPNRLAGLFWDGIPLVYDTQTIVRDRSTLDRPPTKFAPERADGWFLLSLPRLIASAIRSSWRIRRHRRTAKQHFQQHVLPPYLAYIQEKSNQELSQLSTTQLLDELHERRKRILDEFGQESLKPGFFAGLAFSSLQRTLIQLMGTERGNELLNSLTMGLEGDTTAEQNIALDQLANGQIPIEAFLDRFGHRAINEMELAEPRWREDPQQVKAMAGTMHRHNEVPPQTSHREKVDKRHRTQKALPQLLARCGGSSLHQRIEKDLAEVQSLLVYREAGKHYLMMGYELIRLAIMELAHRWQIGNDVFFLHLDELGRFEADKVALLPQIHQRKLRWEAAQRLYTPDIIESQNLDSLGMPRAIASGNHLKGVALSAGIAEGIVRLATDPREIADLGKDYILVCPSADPNWTWLFVHARGLIVERGGVLSHGAIVARDFGIPAVACSEAMRHLRDGQKIRLDGNHGTVQILNGGPCA